MKINSFAILTLLSLVSARRGGMNNHDDNDPLEQKSRVTAFVNTDEGLKVECWEIESLLPPDHSESNGLVRQKDMGSNMRITLFSFAPAVNIFSFGTSSIHANAVDFSKKPNLFTVKAGLVLIEAQTVNGDDFTGKKNEPADYVFADVNGDDWFYFEDVSSSDRLNGESCMHTASNSHFRARTISGSDTTLINFQYPQTPRHRVVHEGRCNFAGLKPLSPSNEADAESKKFSFWNQEL